MYCLFLTFTFSNYNYQHTLPEKDNHHKFKQVNIKHTISFSNEDVQVQTPSLTTNELLKNFHIFEAEEEESLKGEEDRAKGDQNILIFITFYIKYKEVLSQF